MENIKLENNELLVEISPVGAELQRIRDKNGVERLWDGNPAYWSGRAPVLFPIAGGLKDNTYILNGKAYTLEKHGFARKQTFSLETQDDDSATFLLTDAMVSAPGYPFPFAFRVRFTIRDNQLITEYSTENTGKETLYYGAGSHEAFACPEGIESYEIVFPQPETLRSDVMHGPLLSDEKEAIPAEADGTVMKLHDGLFAHDTVIFSALRSRSVTLQSPLHGRRIRVDFADFDNLLLWTKPGAGYLCIEPWTNLPDHMNTDQNIANKPGIIALAPGDARTLTHTITCME